MSRHVKSFWKRLADSSLSELVDLFGNQISWWELSSPPGSRNRVFDQWQTFWIFIGQVLSHSQTCCEALRKAQLWLLLKRKKKFLPTHRPIVRPVLVLAVGICSESVMTWLMVSKVK